MNSFNFLKNYIFIFILSLFLVFITKFIFLLYLFDNFNNYDLITTIKAIFLGYKFDFAVASIVTLLATLFDFHKTSLALLASFLISILFLIQISDIMYFYESSRHIGYEVSDAITDASGLIMTAFSQHTILTISSIIASIFIFYFLVFFLYKNTFKIAFNKYYFIKKILIIVITIFFVRGMFQSIPLNPWQAVQIGDVKLSSLSLNGTYNALYSFFNKSKKLKPIQTPDVSSNVIHTSFKELYNNKNTYNLELLDKPNIVFLFLESWSAVNIKNYGFEKNTTPFFTELLQKSIRPKAMIANGHRTTEGIFATISSFQNPLGRTIAKTQLQDYD
ncbi:sulfatase-like hydrolase/transferase, partial [Poseidonibacter sp.]|uniref:sulfatase-like hydrolase/transferase n=1 Tax=Poseidonibacter sp. TaxID=2321188 RepID=UPI003C78C80E